MATTAAKKALHEKAKAERGRLGHDERRLAALAATDRAARRLAGMNGLVGLYVAIGDEIHPRALIARLAAAGNRLALPTTPVWGAPMVFRAWSPSERLVKGRMNIPEPAPEAPEVFPDIVVVPPVAFDRRCYRIGYGAGFYDRTLPALRTRHPVFAIGFGFSCQEVETVPDEPHDVPLDEIATEAELILPRR